MGNRRIFVTPFIRRPDATVFKDSEFRMGGGSVDEDGIFTRIVLDTPKEKIECWTRQLFTYAKRPVILVNVCVYIFTTSILFLLLTNVKYADYLTLLASLSFLDDWKVFGLMFGTYLTFAVKKIWDVSNAIPSMDKITILSEIAITDERTQEELWGYVSSSVGYAFASLSLKMQSFLEELSVGDSFKRKEEIEVREERITKAGIVSAHFMSVYWSLDLIDKANDNGTVITGYHSTLMKELLDIHSQCDKLINMRHSTFGKILIRATLIILHSFFAITGARNFSTLHFNTHSWWIIAFIVMLHFLFFALFLLSWIFARQIIKPFIKEHDVFELKRIFNERQMVNELMHEKLFERVPDVED